MNEILALIGFGLTFIAMIAFTIFLGVLGFKFMCWCARILKI